MRLAIITGGSKGLGAALSDQFSKRGYQVLEFSRTAPHSYSQRLDLADPEQVLQDLRTSLNAIEPSAVTELVVVNNAGTLAPIGPSWSKPTADAVVNLNVNFMSPILVIGELVRRFRHAQGRKMLVNISSGAALKGYAGWSLYCASKAGMESFFRALAVEEGHQANPFTAISIDPGVIDTDMQALIRATPAHDFPEVARFTRRKEVGGLHSASAVAESVLRVLSRTDLEGGGRYDATPEALRSS